jgi:hypothetical protein
MILFVRKLLSTYPLVAASFAVAGLIKFWSFKSPFVTDIKALSLSLLTRIIESSGALINSSSTLSVPTQKEPF